MNRHLWAGAWILALCSCSSSPDRPADPEAEDTFDQLSFIDARTNEPMTFLRGEAGYLVAYVDLTTDCSSCLKTMKLLLGIGQAYEEVTAVAVNRGMLHRLMQRL